MKKQATKLNFLSIALLSGVFAASAIVSSATQASGGGYGGGSVGATSTPVDHNYELGKAIYSGRSKQAPKIKYCIDDGTEKVKLKRSSLKAFKRKSQSELAGKLYDCDEPDTLALNKIGGDNMAYVLYYLNKRYKLRMTR